MVDVFISYSRANKEFASHLATNLRNAKKDVWIDTLGIRFTSDWWEEIKRGIEHSDNFLLIMSPTSLGSPVCHLEIEHARKLQKRLIFLQHLPFERQETALMMQTRLADEQSAYVNTLIGDRNPALIFDENWYIFDKYQRVNFPYDASKSEKFRLGELETAEETAAREEEESKFQGQFAQVLEALNTDMGHVHLHTRFALLLRDWEASKQNPSFLLFSDELVEAETWLNGYREENNKRLEEGDAPKIPAPSEAQIAFIELSRKEEDARAERLAKIERRLKNAQRFLIFSILAAIVLLFGTLYFTGDEILRVENLNQMSLTLANYLLSAPEDRNIASLDAMVAANPNVEDAYLFRGLALAAEYDYSGAVADYSTAIAINAENAYAYLNRGLANYHLANYDAAIVDYTEAIRIDPNFSIAFNNRGLIYLERGDYAAAIADFAEAVRIEPNFALAYNNRGYAYALSVQHDLAIADYTEAIRLNPTSTRAYLNRGASYFALGREEEGMADYSEALRINPSLGFLFEDSE